MSQAVATPKINALIEAQQALHKANSAVADPLTVLANQSIGELLPREYRGGMTKFTGWKYGFGQSSGFVAQVIWSPSEYDRKSKGMLGVYVNLPGFECGHFERGAEFDIGTMRIQGWEKEAIPELSVAGVKCLLTLVDAYCRSHELHNLKKLSGREAIKTWLR